MAFILFEAVPFIAVCLAHQLLCLVLLILRPLVFRPMYGYARSWTVRFLFGAKLPRIAAPMGPGRGVLIDGEQLTVVQVAAMGDV